MMPQGVPRGCCVETPSNRECLFRPRASRAHVAVLFLLWVVGVLFVAAGVVAILRKQVLYGIVLIVVGFVIGPGGVSLFT